MSSQIIISTSSEIPGKKLASHLGLVVGVGTVAFGPVTTTKTKGALVKAMNQLKSAGIEMQADAIVDVSVAATSSGFAFSRGHTVIVSGTAVKIG